MAPTGTAKQQDFITPEMHKRCFEERLANEDKYNAPVRLDFQVNPVVKCTHFGFQRVEVMAQKPNMEESEALNAGLSGHYGEMAPKLKSFGIPEPKVGTDAYIEQQVAKVRAGPCDLHGAPQTTSQQIGWIDGARLVGWTRDLNAARRLGQAARLSQRSRLELRGPPARRLERPQSAGGNGQTLRTPERPKTQRPQSAVPRLTPERVSPLAEAAPGEEVKPKSPKAHVTRPGSAAPGYAPGTPQRPGTPRAPGTPRPGTPRPGMPRVGTPRVGTPRVGTPRVGTPRRNGTPRMGTPRVGTPRRNGTPHGPAASGLKPIYRSGRPASAGRYSSQPGSTAVRSEARSEAPPEDEALEEPETQEAQETREAAAELYGEDGELIQDREHLGFPFSTTAVEAPEYAVTPFLHEPPHLDAEYAAREREILAELVASFAPPTRRWSRPRKMTEIGRFADSYHAAIGKSAFASKASAR